MATCPRNPDQHHAFVQAPRASTAQKRAASVSHACHISVASVSQAHHKSATSVPTPLATARCQDPLPGPPVRATCRRANGSQVSSIPPPTEAGARGGWRAGRSHPPAEAGATGRCSSALRHPPVEAGATGTAWRPQAKGRSPETRARRGALPPTERLQARSICS